MRMPFVLNFGRTLPGKVWVIQGGVTVAGLLKAQSRHHCRYFESGLDKMTKLGILCILFMCISPACAKTCLHRDCPTGSHVVECVSDGQRNTCEKCHPFHPDKCYPLPHCTPEAKAEFLNAEDNPDDRPVCVCDTTRNYYGKNPLDCKYKSCPPYLDLKVTGECVCSVGLGLDGAGGKCIPEIGTDIDLSGDKTPLIAGSIAAVVGLILIGVAIYCVWKRRRSTNDSYGGVPLKEITTTNPRSAANGSAVNGSAVNGSVVNGSVANGSVANGSAALGTRT